MYLPHIPLGILLTDVVVDSMEKGTDDDEQPDEQGSTNSDDYVYDEETAVLDVDEDIFEEAAIEDYEYTDYAADEADVDYSDEYEDDYDEYVEDEYDVNEDSDTVIEGDDDETEMIDDGPLEEAAVIEEEEEIDDEDINIDAGFLNDNNGNSVELPKATPQASVASTASPTGPTFVFYFCVLGGNNKNGAVSSVDVLSNGISNALQSLSIAPMPSTLTKGEGCSAAYTGQSITSCSNGYTTLSPYGYLYKPGSCADYSIYNNNWKPIGSKLTTFRYQQ